MIWAQHSCRHLRFNPLAQHSLAVGDRYPAVPVVAFLWYLSSFRRLRPGSHHLGIARGSPSVPRSHAVRCPSGPVSHPNQLHGSIGSGASPNMTR